jgi:quinoprotein glucose dehydrogenase
MAQSWPTIKLQPVFPNLKIERPLWLAQAPDDSGRFFVVVQAGKIYVLKKGSDGSEAKLFFDIEDRHPYFSNEDGLLSLAFHPGFRTNGLFYVYYNQQNSPDQHAQPLNFPFRSVISEFKVLASNPDQADLQSERIILQVPQPFGNHKGGELAFGPDGYLYLALGDGGNGGDPLGNGQNTSTLLAKMLRINVNSHDRWGHGQYGIPRDNPYYNEPDMGDHSARKEIFALGLRNAWRYSWDRKTGDLFAGDVGQDLWEEVDIVTNGGNYGWSVLEGKHHFKPGPPGAQYADPILEYPHHPDMLSQGMFPDHGTGLCIIGGYVYRGRQFPALDGVYIYADYAVGTIWGLRYDPVAKRVTDHGKLLQQPKNITSFAEDSEGEVYALTQDGPIFMITVP